MIYFDNAATTNYKPQCVIDAVHLALTKYCVNAHRGSSKASWILEKKINDTRLLACAVAGGKDTTAVFSQNCTSALNLAILGTAKRGGHVVVSATEHNSVLRPLMQLKSRKIVDVTIVYPDKNGQIISGFPIAHGVFRDIIISKICAEAQEYRRTHYAVSWH